MKAAQDRIAADDRLIAEATKAVEPLRKRRDRITKALVSRKTLILRPGDVYKTGTLDCVRIPYFDTAAREALTGIPKAQVEERFGELLRSGNIKVSLANEGTTLTVKGLASKVRLLDAAAAKRIERSRKALADAEARAQAARKAHHDLMAAEHKAGTPLTLAEAVEAWGPALVAELQVKAAEARTRGGLGQWEREALLRDATAHLEHVKSKAKTPCPCIPCTRQRESAIRAANMEAQAKANAKALAAATKVRFTCPTCKTTSVAPVKDGTVKCQKSSCSAGYYGNTLPVSALRTTTVPKSTPIGVVA